MRFGTMVVRGHFQNGVIVLDEPVTLAEGEMVEVSVPQVPAQPTSDSGTPDRNLPTLAEIFKDIIGKAEGLPSDSSVNHDHYLYGTPKR